MSTNRLRLIFSAEGVDKQYGAECSHPGSDCSKKAYCDVWMTESHEEIRLTRKQPKFAIGQAFSR